MLSILLIAFSLAMDVFVVSAAAPAGGGASRFYVFRAALFFGVFQWAMAIFGYLLGEACSGYIESVDHFVAFFLLAFVGAKMIRGAFDKGGGAGVGGVKALLALSIATSLDALAVGASFQMIDRAIWLPAVVFGVVSFAVSIAGFWFGGVIGALFKKRAQIIGGVVLIAIGAQILVEHLRAA
ncbi:MAG: manganese efflux pump MntP family protein [Helicobacteraceae bacterium]|jgi:putative Mn2+ efflux pump MntP|nr:manganese efflux pump MntP family protein [Helicobacteraceae bacterium]